MTDAWVEPHSFKSLSDGIAPPLHNFLASNTIATAYQRHNKNIVTVMGKENMYCIDRFPNKGYIITSQYNNYFLPISITTYYLE